MEQNLLYSLFFICLNASIFLLLTNTFKVNFNVFISTVTLLVVSVLLHSGIVNIPFLKPDYEFFDLLFFSIGLFIFHFGFGGMIWYLKGQHQKWGNSNLELQDIMIPVANFMRLRLTYVMVMSYQLLDIWMFKN